MLPFWGHLLPRAARGAAGAFGLQPLGARGAHRGGALRLRGAGRKRSQGRFGSLGSLGAGGFWDRTGLFGGLKGQTEGKVKVVFGPFALCAPLFWEGILPCFLFLVASIVPEGFPGMCCGSFLFQQVFHLFGAEHTVDSPVSVLFYSLK